MLVASGATWGGRMTVLARYFRMALAGALVLVLAACVKPEPQVDRKPDPIGDFKLGYAIVVAKDAQRGPLSRKASEQELVNAIQTELKRVFGRYEGKRYYHISVTVDAYVLAMPGIPIVASPKSALIFTVRIWDDAKQKQLFDKPKQFTIIEKISGKSLFGSGLTQTKEEQLAGLTRSAVKQIEKWMRENESLFQDPDKTASDT